MITACVQDRDEVAAEAARSWTQQSVDDAANIAVDVLTLYPDLKMALIDIDPSGRERLEGLVAGHIREATDWIYSPLLHQGGSIYHAVATVRLGRRAQPSADGQALLPDGAVQLAHRP